MDGVQRLITGQEDPLLVVDAATIAEAMSLPDWLAVVEQSLRGVSGGQVVQAVRQILPLPDDQPRGRILSMMFGAVRDPAFFGAKVISVFPDNFSRGMASHRGAVLLFDSIDGALVAIMHGGEITAARTAAASAVATRALAREDSNVLSILGYGEQAWRHAEAMVAVRPLDEIRCWGRDPSKSEAFAEKVAACLSVRGVASASVAEAVAGADIVCTTTSAQNPILPGDLLEPGMHLNVVGSSTADYREIDSQAVARSSIWVDYRSMTDVSAGEYRQALAEGVIDETHLVGEIGAALNGVIRGRTDEQEITMFKSLGMPAEDLYSAQMIYQIALAKGVGQKVVL